MKVSIDFSVSDVRTATRRRDHGIVETTVQLVTDLPPTAQARILNLLKQGAPLRATIYSEQALLDLDLTSISVTLMESDEEIVDAGAERS